MQIPQCGVKIKQCRCIGVHVSLINVKRSLHQVENFLLASNEIFTSLRIDIFFNSLLSFLHATLKGH